MNPAYSVILFTTASGAGYGLLALLALVSINHGQSTNQAFAVTAVSVALVLITIGLLSSTLHLGRPERAWRAFSQWRSSWLSREGIAAIATYPVAMVFGAMWSGLIDASWLKIFAGLSVLMCAITVFCTAKIYATLKTIRAWNNSLTVPVYLTFAVATGATLLMAIATVFGRYQIFQAFLAITSVVALAALKFFYWRGIDHASRNITMADATGLGGRPGESVRQWEVPHTNTNFIMKEMGFVVARKHAVKLRMAVFALLGLAILLSALSLAQNWFGFFAVIPAFTAAWVERWLFFADAEHVVNLYYGKAAV